MPEVRFRSGPKSLLGIENEKKLEQHLIKMGFACSNKSFCSLQQMPLTTLTFCQKRKSSRRNGFTKVFFHAMKSLQLKKVDNLI
jgi:hypothetical protein